MEVRKPFKVTHFYPLSIHSDIHIGTQFRLSNLHLGLFHITSSFSYHPFFLQSYIFKFHAIVPHLTFLHYCVWGKIFRKSKNPFLNMLSLPQISLFMHCFYIKTAKF